jgi:hypothetical protein
MMLAQNIYNKNHTHALLFIRKKIKGITTTYIGSLSWLRYALYSTMCYVGG